MFKFLTASLLLAPAAAMAQAAEGAAPAAGSPVASLLPLVLIFVVFYFLLIKPQQKRLKEHQAMLGALKRGDEVVTGGGIIGKVTKVADGQDHVTVEIAEGVEVRVLKSTVTGLLNAMKAPAQSGKKAAGNKNDNAVVDRERVANDN